MRLPILYYPDPRLRNRALPVKRIDAQVLRLLDDMLETMYASDGIGLAGPQVNVLLRLITIDISPQRNQPLCLINPEIISADGKLETREGCLSVPGVYEPVERAEHIRYRRSSGDGELEITTAKGLLAVCIQHEIDHLDGKLFVDYLSVLKRQRIRTKAQKQQRKDHAAQR